MPKPREPIPSPLDALRATIERGAVGHTKADPPAEAEVTEGAEAGASDQDTSLLVSQAPSLPGEQDTGRLVSQDPISKSAKSSSGDYRKLGVYLRLDSYKWLKVQSALTGREISDIVDALVQQAKAEKERG